MQNSFKSYVRSRDYCTTGKHVIQMCLNVIKVSIELGNFVHVNNYISKAEQTPESQSQWVAKFAHKLAMPTQDQASTTWYTLAALQSLHLQAILLIVLTPVLAPVCNSVLCDNRTRDMLPYSVCRTHQMQCTSVLAASDTAG